MGFFTKMPSTTTLLSAYTTVAGFAMLIRTILNEAKSIIDQFIPEHLQERILSLFGILQAKPSTQLTLIIEDHIGNQMYEAAEVYLRTKVTNPSIQRLKVTKHQREKNLTITVEKDQEIVEVFEGVQVEWKLTCLNLEGRHDEQKYFELHFEKQYKQVVIGSYLPYVLERSKAINEENRVLKLHSLGYYGDDNDGEWGSINLDHPSTFDTLAMDPELKKKVMEDLDRFVERKEFYKRVGKPWKRGYLLYGPPGTGKSSLIAAIANYLKFHVYDVELSKVYDNSRLRDLLVSTKNKSIIVIEDIDCNVQFHDRENTDGDSNRKLTLSGMLNFIDGLWSSCGDERIIIFTTNHKDKLDPALLRPGRMDMHIHMSYCTPSGFKILASNYLEIENHPLFEEIETLLGEVNATPAEVAEELMTSDDAKSCLEGLIRYLKEKKVTNAEGNKKDVQHEGNEKAGEVRKDVESDSTNNSD